MPEPDFTSTVDIARPDGDERTAEQWARAVWEDAPAPVRAFLRAGWAYLGLRVRRAPGRVFGWTVVESTPETVVLEAPSSLMAARNVVHVDGARVRWTTTVSYRRPVARLLWAVATPFHERLIPSRLRHVAAPASRDDRKHRAVTAFQRRIGNPLLRRLPTQTLLETTGRSSGLPRRTPIGGRRTGRQFWLVSEFGERSHYVRNIQADPRVRVRLHGVWYTGTARLLPDDDARARLKALPRLNSTAVQAFGTDLLTIRVDLG
ncbi:nitroreductase/quinone reductase family protein [Amycolatopsis sp. NBC_00345]|uniref:nitroreductase/quinone reductase family protein n=1 Tax=Amycolatopsis sp. NBC_00345 TaxID=2975955 RepID=UPI002E254ECE